MFFNHKNTEPGNRRVRIHFFIMAEIIPEKHPNLFIIPESRTITCVCPFQHTSEKFAATTKIISIWKGCT